MYTYTAFTLGLIPVALIGFIFLCISRPQLVKHKSQFYMAIAVAGIIILLSTLGAMFGEKFDKVMLVMVGFGDLIAFVLLILATGGMSLQDLGSELSNAYEVMRRGDTQKTVIVPLTGQKPKPRQDLDENDEPRQVFTLNEGVRKPAGGPIPLDDPEPR